MTMEEWEKHIHLTTGHCFEMFYRPKDATIRFKVKGSDSFGTIQAINCQTREEFKFNKHELLKIEYGPLKEVDFDHCK